ncbi:hypothetical protein [Halorubrum amylolyticum]|uniref:hypothetical protein n=1 Tax=Halorubrum amylolyticum TaxID=2508724 RepID=UPI001008B759|nr:hypothetical protein [Halorubrum amylolyticum]
MVSDAADAPGDPAERPGDPADDGDKFDSILADRWLALDRGWRALALGLGVVAAHAAGQAAGLF